MSQFHFVMPTSTAGTLCGSPLADNFNNDTGGATDTDVVCMSKYHTAYFLLFWGVGATGTFTATAVPCDNATPSNETTDIPFQYMRVHTTETNTDWAWATSDSLTTTLGSHQIYVIKVAAADLPLVTGVKYEYVKVHIVEGTDSALLGGCIIMMADPRYDEDTLDAVTT